MDPAIYDRLTQRRSEGAEAILRELIGELERDRQYHRLFEALLLQARHGLGLPVILSTDEEFPSKSRTEYEDRIVGACRRVGALWLQAGDIPGAFHYFHMIGEVEPIRSAIDAYQPTDDPRADVILDICLRHAVHPAKGIAIVLERYGVCQAITACEQALSQGLRPAARNACVAIVVRALHRELVGRLSAAIDEQEGPSARATSVSELIADRDWLFEDDNYHIDTSHLNAVVRLARLLDPSPEIELARALCDYGARLSSRYRYPEPAPFEDVYVDGGAYFDAILGRDANAALAWFREKADACDAANGELAPVEVYVGLLAKMGRLKEALEYAGGRLNAPARAPALCPTINELCAKANDYSRMADLARRRDDVVTFAAALLRDAGDSSRLG